MASFKQKRFPLYSPLCVFFFFFSFFLCCPYVLAELSSTQKASMINLSKYISVSAHKWNVSKEPCSWKGIKCSNNNASVAEISLSGYGLSSSDFLPGLCGIWTLQALDVSNNHLTKIPDQFMTDCGRLTGLKRLNFSGNRLVGHFPKFVGFAALESLDFSVNLLNGSVGPELEGLNGLRALNLNSNKFGGSVPSLVGKKSMALKEFILSANSFQGSIPTELFGHRGLTHIDLSHNKLSGVIPDRIGELSKLEVLLLSSNNLDGEIPRGLLNITTLSRFAANENKFTGGIPSGITKSLKNFDLSYNRLTGSIPFELLSGPNLETLDLSFNQLEDPIPENISSSLIRLRLGSNLLNGSIPMADFSTLEQLAYLELDNNRLTGSIPPRMGSCKRLALLNLAGNRLSGGVPSELGNLSNLQVLKIQSNGLYGKIPTEITQLKLLSVLNISWNSLSGQIPASISSLQSLDNLNLNGNEFSGPIPSTISEMRSLLELQLGGNKLSGNIPQMPLNLQIALNLSNNLFEGPIPKTLSALPSLEVLDLSNNKFSGEIPVFLTQLSSLTRISLSNNSLSGVIPKFRSFTAVDWEGNKGLNDATKSDSLPVHKKRNPVGIIVLSIAVSFVVVVIVAAALVILSRRYFRVKDGQLQPVEEFPFPQIIQGNLLTTNPIHRSNIDFSKTMELVSVPANIVLKTRFSTYYKTVTPSGSSYYVKKLNLSDTIPHLGSRALRFGFEIEVFGRLNNSNIMTPLAYLLTTESAYLFYEHFSKGTLFDALHGSSRSEVDWASRYSIAVGIAQGISFLHGAASGPILLLDLSSKSIFLKSLKEPQVGDIELYKVIDPSKSTGSISTVAGSVGYIPPEYAYTMRVAMTGNVYSFGVILLELLTGKPAVSEGTELAKWVLSFPGKQENMLDFGIARTSVATKSQMLAVMKIALGCVSVSPEARPKMKSVLRMLLTAR